MTRDREVNLGNLNDVTVDDHGDAGRRPSSAGSNKPSGKGAGKPPKAPKTPPPASHGGGGGWMIACLVLVVLIAVMGVWFHKQMTVLQAQMASAFRNPARNWATSSPGCLPPTRA